MNRSPIVIFIICTILISCSQKKQKEAKHSNKSAESVKLAGDYLDKAEYFYAKQQFDSAYYYYNKSKISYETEKDSMAMAYNLIQMARIQQVFGDYFGSELNLVETFPYIKDNTNYKSAVYNLLGISAKELNNFEDAKIYYRKAKEYTVSTLAKLGMDNNIGVIFIKEKKYDNAIYLLERILENDSIQKEEYNSRKARVQDNLGYAYFKNGEKEKGLQLMNKALLLKQKQKDSYGSIESYLHLSEYYIENNRDKAYQNADMAYKEATKNNSIDERLKALFLLIKTSQNKQYILKYAYLNDSIIQVRNQAKNQFAKIKYDARLASEENLKLKNKNISTDLKLEKSQNEKNVWISASAILISLLFILYNHLKNKNKLEKQKATYLTETKIAKKIHDEIANDVFQTMAFVETKKIEEPENKETLINLLDNLYKRSRNISKENESIETGESFIENLMEMINGYKSSNQNIIIKKDETINWGDVSQIKKITLFRVLQELLVNMKKHSEASIVIVSFTNSKNEISIDYSDNGKGLEMKDVKKSGIANVENRIQNINGRITFDTTGNGLKIKISIPK